MGHPHAGTSSCECGCHPAALELLERVRLQSDTFAVEVMCSECDCSGLFGVDTGPAASGPAERVAPPAPSPRKAPRGASFFRRPGEAIFRPES